MVRKFKLIKEYPGSPKLGSIIMDTNPNNGAKDSWFEENWGKAHKLSFKLGINTQPDRFPEFWEKIEEKQPLFITEDDKEIFEEDIYYFIKRNSVDIVNDGYAKKGHYCGKNIEDYVYFSTKEAAEKWIDENKPKYSLKQAASFIQQFDLEINQFNENSLEDYMKMIKLEYDKT